MPITRSAEKALRQNIRRKAHNLIYKNKIKNLIKEARDLVSERKVEEAKKLLPQVYKILDKAAKVGLIKKNTASRKKSRITKLINKPQTPWTPAGGLPGGLHPKSQSNPNS